MKGQTIFGICLVLFGLFIIVGFCIMIYKDGMETERLGYTTYKIPSRATDGVIHTNWLEGRQPTK
jgi:hypothetical protein